MPYRRSGEEKVEWMELAGITDLENAHHRQAVTHRQVIGSPFNRLIVL